VTQSNKNLTFVLFVFINNTINHDTAIIKYFAYVKMLQFVNLEEVG
jgi:hypothetical protein